MAYTPPGRTRARVLRFVRERLHEGRPPTVREVQEAFGFRAVESARAHLEALVAEGRLAKDSGRARGYRLPGRRGVRPSVLVPLLGRVPAGPPEEAVEEADEFVAVAGRAAPEGLFALRVRGDSMTGAGILDGDVVVVRRQATADDGAVVVARIGGEATVKRLRLRGGPAGPRAELVPENPAYAAIPLEPGAGEILGRVVEVRRTLEER